MCSVTNKDEKVDNCSLTLSELSDVIKKAHNSFRLLAQPGEKMYYTWERKSIAGFIFCTPFLAKRQI